MRQLLIISLLYNLNAFTIPKLTKRESNGLFDDTITNLLTLSDTGSGTTIATKGGKLVGLEAKTNLAQYPDEGTIFPKEKVKDSSESPLTKLVKGIGLSTLGNNK
ncbi:hypothetical protein CONCODRAFT_68114 [Conidiobolus coronatus NRRL 28638]|uniref:Uncharacterized protein n=1 Tax=Conidiobolus coronatus (strain ATCC 28846 / CBS 209.66 / NRRL 28638) TaxID=796925 RepID=A0A137PFB2_CONC2|nr:hypothetical protein CONCODRAFT_68114 [Conidiobolus coronatus NRRL 28638]|eukprot:KXN73699.1 hypothetical protein CONCODRAFT_68114 [Conidiobolus coronatus NRRL 28638]